MSKPKINQFCWNELATPNVKAAKEFYGAVFGWTFTDHDMGEMIYTMIQSGDETFGGMWAIPKDQEQHIPPHWMAYILVENLEDSLEKSQKNGASVVKPIAQAGDMGLFAIITDPTGAHIALWQSLEK